MGRKVRMANSNLKVARPMSTVTPVHSSLVGLLRDYTHGLFPAQYFKDRDFVGTELAFRPGNFGNRRTRFRPMEGSNVQQLRYPFLSIRVEPSAEVSQLGSLDSFWQGRQFVRTEGLYEIFRDDDGLRSLGYERERMVCRFNLSVLAQTDLQGYEVMHYLKRTMPVDRSTFLRGATIYTTVPADIIRDIYVDLGLSPSAPGEDLPALGAYLRSVSAGRLLQTIDSATGRVSYSFPYRANPVFRVQGPPQFSVNRDGNVVRWAEVSWSVEMDLEVPITFVYEQQARLAPRSPPSELISSDEQAAYFGLTIDLAPPLTMAGGLSLVYFTNIVTGPASPASPGEADVTDLGPSIPPEVRAYISSIVNGPEDPALRLQTVVRVGTAVIPPTNYSVDWSNFRISILPPNLLYNQLYQVLVYCDLGGYAEATPDNTGRRQAPSPFFLRPLGLGQSSSP